MVKNSVSLPRSRKIRGLESQAPISSSAFLRLISKSSGVVEPGKNSSRFIYLLVTALVVKLVGGLWRNDYSTVIPELRTKRVLELSRTNGNVYITCKVIKMTIT